MGPRLKNASVTRLGWSKIGNTLKMLGGAAREMKMLGGAAREIRTPDPIITNDVLYQLSYCGPVEQRRTGANRTALLSMPVLPVLAIR
jgi:hypothetical protein